MQSDTMTRASGRRIAPVDIGVSERDRERAFRSARHHTILVKALKAILPSIALICIGYYGFMLAAGSALRRANVSVSKMTIDPTNLAMADPRYSGFGKDGSEYKVHAESAVTDLRMSGPVKLNVIDGQITQPSGVVTRLKARWGTFDQKKNLLELYEAIDVDTSNGMKARLTRATVLAKDNKVISTEPVVAESETGRIKANSMTLDTKARKAEFVDAVEVTLKPSASIGKAASATTAGAAGGVAAGADPRPNREPKAFGIDPGSKEPVVVTSRRLDVDDTAKTALFRENVVARQGEASMASPELDVFYAGQAGPGDGASAGKAAPKQAGQDGAKLKAIRARGGVEMTNKADRATSQSFDYDAETENIVLEGDVVMTQQPDRRVTAQKVVLDQKADTALLTEGVVVMQGRNSLRGERLAIDRSTGTAKLTSPAGAGRGPGRIATVLYQNQTGRSGKAAAKSGEHGDVPFGPLGASFKTNPNAPISVDAAVLDVNDRKHMAIYTGAVVAKQDTFVVKTEEMTAFYQGEMGLMTAAPGAEKTSTGASGTQLKRIEARRGVVVNGADGQQATGEWANFDVAANTIVMGGNVVVSQGKQIVRAPDGMRLHIDLTSGLTRFEPEPGAAGKSGAKVSGAYSTSSEQGVRRGRIITCPPGAVCKSGRLEAIFYPNQFKEKAKGSGGSVGSGDRSSTQKRSPQTGSAWESTSKPASTP